VKLVFATNNLNKIKEVKNILPERIFIRSLSEIGCSEELPETGSTIKSNAWQKGRYVHDKYGVDCFADDTGLEVASLGGRPGVYSARFAGPDAVATDNIEKLLSEMKGSKNRSAVFRTVIALFRGEEEYFFEGTVSGTIAEIPAGGEGFGYDPVFIPEGYTKTFAEMTVEEKNSISHRKIAVDKLAGFLIEKM
jgi:XTP/dITP diphosphohydrolase